MVRPLRASQFGLSNTIAELCILKTSIYCKNYLFIGWRIYQCDLCGKKMTYSNNLANHRKCVHEGTRNHTCETCGKSFSSAQKMKHHIKAIHNGQKDYKCESCGKAFSEAGNLKKHINSLHNS